MPIPKVADFLHRTAFTFNVVMHYQNRKYEI